MRRTEFSGVPTKRTVFLVVVSGRRHISRILRFCFIGVLFFTVLHKVAWSQEHSIWWSPDLELRSIAGVQAKLDEAVPLDSGLVLTMTKDRDEMDVSNCSEFLHALDGGFGPATNLASKLESAFIGRCYTLFYLQRAKAATRSYIGRRTWSASDLSIYPPLLQFGEGAVLDKVRQAQNQGQSWQSFDPKISVERIDNRSLTLSARGTRASYTVEIMATADFNGDGVEDIAVSGCANAIRGTFGACEFYILTRLSDSAAMRVIVSAPGNLQ